MEKARERELVQAWPRARALGMAPLWERASTRTPVTEAPPALAKAQAPEMAMAREKIPARGKVLERARIRVAIT